MSVNFFTPVSFSDLHPKKPLEGLMQIVDHYFYFGGEKALVLPNGKSGEAQEVRLTSHSTSWILTAYKIFSYTTIILPLIALAAKFVFRATHEFKVLGTVQEHCEEDIEINKELEEELTSLLPSILETKDDTRIEWIQKEPHRVFSLTSSGNYVFTIGGPQPQGFFKGHQTNYATTMHFQNVVKGHEVQLAHNLDTIHVPHAKLLQINGQTILVQERFAVSSEPSAREEKAKEVVNEKMARQLTQFVHKTGFIPNGWENLAPLGPGHVAILSCANFYPSQKGSPENIVSLMPTPATIKAAVKERERLGTNPRWLEMVAKDAQLAALARDERMATFYEKNGAKANPRQPIEVDLDSDGLGLNLEQKAEFSLPSVKGDNLEYKTQDFTLREAIETVIGQINEKLSQTPDEASLKGKRSISLSANTPGSPLYHFDHSATSELDWITDILKALQEKGYIFELVHHNGHGWFIQV